ncbi:protein spinster-like isoform X4 [Daphnia pulex]|uniref:protein spinster-like isoform X4 n=1 Tax=Daphnia pulex TaxID=6669 RepID=UPI001EDCB45F|nr:protein spinster-like isoform X4 [Daphnia pulex]XP_046460300.1 protein spinster-like isoform X4 [Daphnia pulex]
MDSSGIRANMSAQQLIDHEVYERSLRNPNSRQDGKVSTDSSGSSSLSSSNTKIDGKGIPSASDSSANSSSGENRTVEHPLTKRQIITVTILCFVNLINYMDRYTIAGILTQIQCDLNIGDTEGGLLQTAFVAIYMICAPVFGYLGDRYSRRLIMAAGIFVWSLTTLLGSYMTNFWAFLVMRSLVGVGEASYSTIAPTIISDLFVGDTRSKFLALFYFAIPVGSGLGYIVGSEASRVMGSWHWGLRVTPVFGAVAVLLILLVVQDPPRGESEGAHLSATSWWDDIKSLGKNKSFVMSTAACTAVAFVAGALAWWGPKFIALGLATQQGHQDVSLDDVSYIFGLIAMIAGLLGVPLGSFLGQKLRVRYQRADPIVCGMGMLFSTPLMLAALFIAGWNTTTCFVVVFFGQVLLNLNWAIVADILLYTVIPTRRSTAEAFQILFSHALGDAGSPYLIGQISEILKKSFSTPAAFVEGAMVLNSTVSSIVSDFVTSSPDMNVSANCSSSGTSSIDLTTVEGDFKALQWAMSITIVVEVLGALFFFGTAWYIVEDKAKVDRAVADGPRGFRAVSMKELPASLMWNGHPSDLVTSKKIGLGFDDETRQLSPSRNRRPDSNGTPEEEQPITIIAPASDYLSVI